MEKSQHNLLGRQIGLKLGVDGRFALPPLGAIRVHPASVAEAIVATTTGRAPVAPDAAAMATAMYATPTTT
jgi:hypothetical protein